MKVTMIKGLGGILSPPDEIEAHKMEKFKNFGMYEIEIKTSRNPKFHAKVFAFFKFCFEFWKGDREFMDEPGQFDVFRRQLTVCAGFYDEFCKFDGSVRIEAKSLSYSNMNQEEFEQCYFALTNAAMNHIFKDCSDDIYNQLLSFF